MRRQYGERFATRVERRAKIGRLTGELRRLCRAELIAGGQQPIESLSVTPIQLVRNPGGQWGLRQSFDALGCLRIAGLFERCCKGVTRGRELCERQLEQLVDFSFRFALPPSPFPLV